MAQREAWRDLLARPGRDAERFVAPWLGGFKVRHGNRTWRLAERPRQYDWYLFEPVNARQVKVVGSTDRPANLCATHHTARGYLAGDRFVPERARVDSDPDKLVEQTAPIYLVERGLDLFTPVLGAFTGEKQLVFGLQLFDSLVEMHVRAVYNERGDSLKGIKDVSPALDLAFRFMTAQREVIERARAEAERRRLELERRERAQRDLGTGLGRRVRARTDFESAARAALRLSGAELISAREAPQAGEMIVQYLHENRRLECVCDRHTLGVIDAGVCLTDENTGEKYDSLFTLESLPGVITEAVRLGRLVVWRHA